MKFAVIGGDKRSALLSMLLAKDGHRVYTFALEKAELPAEIPKAHCLQGCVYGADCVILPVPAENGRMLNSPLSEERLGIEELISALWPGQVLCGGKISDDTCIMAGAEGLRVEDLMCRQEFVTGNAAVTAEGAIALLMQSTDRALLGSSVLICGWGRIGKLLALRLKALGARVCIAARRGGSRAMAELLGMESCAIKALPGRIGSFDFVINTVPARILGEETLCCAAEEALLMELASAPGGFDRKLAENIGLKVLYAPGLPGKYAPYTAAELIKRSVCTIMSEEEG